MLKFTVGGRSVSASGLQKELLHAAFLQVAVELRHRFSSIRHPETGEFAFVTIHGHALDDMRLRIEGSAALIEVVKSRLPQDNEYAMTFTATDKKKTPRLFLSYSFADRDLAERIATALQAQGIDTWWAEWEIESGDSFRRKIDAGLANCTHFMVLLTPNSIQRPWVNEEIDAGFVRKVNATSRFIALRHQLPLESLPPLMTGMLCPEIDSELEKLKLIISEIHGLTRKPELGPAPIAVSAPSTGYSAAATVIAELYVRESKKGGFRDASFQASEIALRTNLPQDDVVDALYELRAFFSNHHDTWAAETKLYAEFDQYWQPWNPEEDALKLAVDLLNDASFPGQPSKIAERYGWDPRRLNPAIFYLKDRDVIKTRDAIGGAPYLTISLSKTDATRRYVKSRS